MFAIFIILIMAKAQITWADWESGPEWGSAGRGSIREQQMQKLTGL